MLGHDALCLWNMPPVPRRAQAATCVTSSWRASCNINAKFPFTLWGARAVPSISDGYVGINRREDTVIILTSLKRLDVRPLTLILPLDVQSEWTLSAQLPPQQTFILSFFEKGGFPFNFLWHHVCIFVIGWETGNEKLVAVRELWGICHKRYVIPT